MSAVDVGVDVDIGVVLGCTPGSPLLRARLTKALSLWRSRRVRRLFLTGTAAEAAAMVDVVRGAGVDEDAVVVDDAAARTLDNLLHARALVGGAPCVIVTSRFHVPRVRFLARRLGMNAAVIGSDEGPVTTTTLLREAVSCAGVLRDVLARRV